MASPKMLEQRLRDLEREALIRGERVTGPREGGGMRVQKKLTKERARPVAELVAAAKAGDEGALALLDAMRQEMISDAHKRE